MSLKRAFVAGILGLALLWRLPVAPEEWGFTFCENDSLFHLHRVDACLADFPHVRSIDPYSHYPEGYRVHWRSTLTAAYSAVAKIAGIEAGNLTSLSRALSPIPPLFGLLAVWIVMRLATDLGFGAAGTIAIGFASALSTGVTRPFFYGVIDHHLYAHLAVLLMLAADLRRSLALWAVAHATLLFATPEGPFYSFIGLGAFAVARLVGRYAGEVWRSRDVVAWAHAPAVSAALAWGISYVFETDPLPPSAGTWVYLSWVHVLALTLLGVFATISSVGAPRWAFPFGIGVAATLAATAVGQSVGGDHGLFELFIRPSERLRVSEESAGLQLVWSSVLPWHLLLLMAAAFHAFRLAVVFFRGHAERLDSGRVSLAIAGALGFFELRHFYVFSSIQILGLALVLRGIAESLENHLGAALARIAVPAAAAAIAALFLAANVADPRRLHGDVCKNLRTIDGAIIWLRNRAPEDGEGVPAKAVPAVYAPWFVGHQIHVLGRHPVVVDPFNYPIPIEERLRAIWWAEKTDDLVAGLERYGARFLLLMEPAASIFGLPSSDSMGDLILGSDGDESRLSVDLLRFATFRHYVAGGFSPEGTRLRPRFLSPERETITATRKDAAATEFEVPRVVILEVVRGVTIEGEIPPNATEVYVDFVVRLPHRTQPIAFRRTLSDHRAGRFVFRTAIPAPVEETTFRIENGYCLSAGSRSARIEVAPEAIDRGAVIHFEWPNSAEGGAPCVATPAPR